MTQQHDELIDCLADLVIEVRRIADALEAKDTASDTPDAPTQPRPNPEPTPNRYSYWSNSMPLDNDEPGQGGDPC